ncbi:Isochorismatase hydrolase [Hypomontagnella monticulosa]|nr:Isochorismatase hydrolase [Hypomontagnella monticulosa]
MRAYSILTIISFVGLGIAIPFSSKLHKKTALAIIDVQNDFINGSLANPRAPAILPRIYQLLDNHEWPFIVASQDWHPPDHVSFFSNHPGKVAGDTANDSFVDTATKTETQMLYAAHCIPETWGAEIERGIQTRLHSVEGYRAPVNYIKKAQDHRVDSYSAFADNQYHRFTTLHSELALHGIETLVMTGLLTNACVRGTSIDGIKLGYQVVLIADATETTSDADKAAAIEELEGWGVQVMNLTDWENANVTPSRSTRTEL